MVAERGRTKVSVSRELALTRHLNFRSSRSFLSSVTDYTPISDRLEHSFDCIMML